LIYRANFRFRLLDQERDHDCQRGAWCRFGRDTQRPSSPGRRRQRSMEDTYSRAATAEAMRQLRTAVGSLHRNMKDTADTIGTFLVDAFHLLALFAIGATTVWAAAATFIGMVAQGRASLGDILLLFIYLEVGAMVGIYFKTTRLPVRHLIYIAITALGRVLVEIVGAEHRTGMDILVVSGAILVLSCAVLVLRFGSYTVQSDMTSTDLRPKKE
jgi:protein PsiE